MWPEDADESVGNRLVKEWLVCPFLELGPSEYYSFQLIKGRYLLTLNLEQILSVLSDLFFLFGLLVIFVNRVLLWLLFAAHGLAYLMIIAQTLVIIVSFLEILEIIITRPPLAGLLAVSTIFGVLLPIIGLLILVIWCIFLVLANKLLTRSSMSRFLPFGKLSGLDFFRVPSAVLGQFLLVGLTVFIDCELDDAKFHSCFAPPVSEDTRDLDLGL